MYICTIPLIELSLPHTGYVTLKIFNMMGEEVSTLVSENRNAGIYKVDWNANDFPSGAYFYRLQSGKFVETKKLMLLK
jgi:hypothetical protein